jgi:hypothetical protein
MDDIFLAEAIGALFSLAGLIACVYGLIFGLNKLFDSFGASTAESSLKKAEEGIAGGSKAIALIVCIVFVGLCMVIVTLIPN